MTEAKFPLAFLYAHRTNRSQMIWTGFAKVLCHSFRLVRQQTTIFFFKYCVALAHAVFHKFAIYDGYVAASIFNCPLLVAFVRLR